ncbi:hypothetical protein [Marinitoga sp. 1138]|uniref:hypothetical protein n=1 Tax=Marinitoga sp. 1138 TaxID=1643334 RepID=UPI001586A40B|nr:hypothetical protein [Marinitoga sp. 1138]
MGKKLLFLSKEKKIEVESDNNILDLFSVFEGDMSLKLFIDEEETDLSNDKCNIIKDCI